MPRLIKEITLVAAMNYFLVLETLVVGILTPSPVRAFHIAFGSGPKIAHVCDLPPDAKVEFMQKLGQEEFWQQIGRDVAVGFRYDSFRLHYCEIWTWNGEYVLYNANRYWRISEDDLIELTGKSPSELGKPWVYRYPPGALILGAIFFVFFCFRLYVKAGDRSKIIAHDPQYQEALRIFADEAKKSNLESSSSNAQRDAAFEKALTAAVNYLRGQGIPQQEAEGNMKLILKSFGARVT